MIKVCSMRSNTYNIFRQIKVGYIIIFIFFLYANIIISIVLITTINKIIYFFTILFFVNLFFILQILINSFSKKSTITIICILLKNKIAFGII